MHSRRTLTAALVCVLSLIIPACIGPPLLITPEELPNGVEGTAYSQDLSTNGGARETWGVDGGMLPDGLALGRGTGTIAGTPATSGTFTLTVGVRSPGLPPRAGAGDYTLTIIPQLTLDTTLAAARVNIPYDATLGTTGGVTPYTFTVIGLPAGLAFDTAAGTISGTPINPYQWLPLTITVSDSGNPPQTVTRQASLVIKPEGVAITTTELPVGNVDTAYSAQLTATAGQPPHSWSIEAGVLPEGLRLNLDGGVISGTPTTAETATIVIRVTDSDSPPSVDSVEMTITIDP